MKTVIKFLLSEKVYMILVLFLTSYCVEKHKYSLAIIEFGLFILIALKISLNNNKKNQDV
jgi:hypothetical protein